MKILSMRAYGCDQTLVNVPSDLQHLTLGPEFDEKLENLPNSLQSLTFDYCSYFNQKLENLPPVYKV